MAFPWRGDVKLAATRSVDEHNMISKYDINMRPDRCHDVAQLSSVESSNVSQLICSCREVLLASRDISSYHSHCSAEVSRQLQLLGIGAYIILQ